MSEKSFPVLARFAIPSAALVIACQHVQSSSQEISLHGFSNRNYVNLNKALGTFVCVRGKILIDSTHQVVYFPLKPIIENDVITIGVSRVKGLSYDYVHRNAMVDGRRYRVCGNLRDATPFQECEDNDCRWYNLENAVLRQ